MKCLPFCLRCLFKWSSAREMCQFVTALLKLTCKMTKKKPTLYLVIRAALIAVSGNFHNLVKLPAQRSNQSSVGKSPSRTTSQDVLCIVAAQKFAARGQILRKARQAMSRWRELIRHSIWILPCKMSHKRRTMLRKMKERQVTVKLRRNIKRVHGPVIA